MVNDPWRPNPGKQELAHRSSAYELFFGGAAGGGKSEFLVVEALRYIGNPLYTAVLFRRTFPELAQARGLISRSKALYPRYGGKYNQQEKVWRFPSGASITFSHMEHEDDKFNHQSAEYVYIGFDELTTFTESQYLYMMSRARSISGLPVRIRAASNPGNVGHEWVKARFGLWLSPDELGFVVEPGEIRYFKRVDDVDVECAPDALDALSRSAIPAKLSDNPKLVEADPAYVARLRQMALVDREQLLNGNWDIQIAGNVFKAEWFKRLVRCPDHVTKWVRYYDLAASVKTHGHWTASAAVGMDEDANIYIRDMYRAKKEWPDARKDIKRIILGDVLVRENGVENKLHGIAAVQEFLRDPELIGKAIRDVNVDTDKLSRALPWSQRAESGKVFLIQEAHREWGVEPGWVEGFLTRAALFDGTGKTPDDEIDSVSGGVQMLAQPKWRKIPFLHL